MMDDTKVSIVITTHNRCDLLRETMDSVFKQTLTQWELIIVDDASTDETWSQLQDISDPRVSCIRLDQSGERCKARNTGLEAANGEYVLFLDDDDLLIENALELHIGALTTNPQAVVSVGKFTSFDTSGSTWSERFVRRQMQRDVSDDLLFSWTAIGGQCVLRTESIRAVDGWNEAYNFAEDLELWLRMSQLGPFVLIPDQVILYRLHAARWRPLDGNDLVLQIREQGAKNQPAPRRRRAEKIVKGSAMFAVANQYRRSGMPYRAFCRYLRVFLRTPGVIRSPLGRPRAWSALVQSFTECVIGKRCASWIRRGVSEPSRPGQKVDSEGFVLNGQLQNSHDESNTASTANSG